MENFVKYIKEISKNPILSERKEKTTTILMPELDTTEGMYRSILPSYVFTGHKQYRMLCIGLTTKMKISPNEKDFALFPKLIDETDHFVFPFVSYPLQPIIDVIREYRVKHNNNRPIRFSYYIDANFYLMPDQYPFAKEYNQAKMIEVIEANIKAVDQVIVTNKLLKNYIADKIKEKYTSETFNTLIAYQPLFVLPEITKAPIQDRPHKGVRILIIADEYQFSDINYIKGILEFLKNQLKDKIEIFILGFDGKRGGKDFLTDLEFYYIPQSEFYKYFQTIRNIAPDCLVIPGKKTKFNETSKNYIKYLEFACMEIPVIAPDFEPYRTVIEPNRTGFLAKDKDDFKFQIETLISDSDKFKGVINFANALATLDYNIAAKDNIDLLSQIYFPDEKTGKK